MIRVITAWLGVMIVFSASAQKEYQVMDWKTDQTVYTHLLHKMRKQYDQRRSDLSVALSSPDKMKVYRDSCKARYLRILGEFPSRTPLNVKRVGTIQRNGYSVEKLIYESVPSHHVTANVYVPEGNAPFPAVLLMCGHEDDAKATESYQKTAALFALNGFIVLVVDPVSQAERHQITDPQKKPATRGGTTEHTLINAAANLVGTGTVAYQLWDNVRGIDYLESRPDVDKSRIGCLGNSGGGTQTTYLVGFDERIKVAAPCSYVASRERNFELFGPNDGCQHVPNEGEQLLEISDFLIMFSPKPLLILAGKYDFVDYTGTKQAFGELAAVYNVLNAGDRVKLFTFDDGHGISRPKREAAVKWFRTWLCGDSSSVAEKDIAVLPREMLKGTTGYSVMGSYSGEINDLQRADQLVTRKHSASDQEKKVRDLLGAAGKPPSGLSAEIVREVPHRGGVMQRIILRRKEGIPLPLLMLVPEGKIADVVVWFHQEGKGYMADRVDLIDRYLNQGTAVVLADISGTGELSDNEKANDPKYQNREYRTAMLALHTGTSLPVMRARDILSVIDFLGSNERTKDLPLSVNATGICAVPALHAAVIDKRISSLTVEEKISSFTQVIHDPLMTDQYSFVIPGVLKWYDIADLKRLLGERLKPN